MKKNIRPKVCKQCGATFKPNGNRALYCSTDCYTQHVNEGRPSRPSELAKIVAMRGVEIRMDPAEEAKVIRRCISAFNDGVLWEDLVDRFGNHIVNMAKPQFPRREPVRGQLPGMAL